jgi:hypothetical protein
MKLKYVTEIMKRVLMIEGRSHFTNEKSVLFLKAAGIDHDHEVRNGGNWSLMVNEQKAEQLEEFYRYFIRRSLAQLFESIESVQENK